MKFRSMESFDYSVLCFFSIGPVVKPNVRPNLRKGKGMMVSIVLAKEPTREAF